MFGNRSILRHWFLRPLVSAAVLGSMMVSATPPGWWSNSNPPVIVPNAANDNHGIANVGQAKWMLKCALDALQDVVPGVAANVRADVVGHGRSIGSLSAPTNPQAKNGQYSPLLLGQLKAIVAPFYNRINAFAPLWLDRERAIAGLPQTGEHLPWSNSTLDDENRAPALIGQLKAVFALDFDADRETGNAADGLSDLWEYHWFGNLLQDASDDPDGDDLINSLERALGTNPILGDTDGDGLPDGDEYTRGTNPNSTDSDGIPDGTEAGNGTDPNGPADATDSDNDGLMDSKDADPGDPAVCWKKVPEASYTVIELTNPFPGFDPIGAGTEDSLVFYQLGDGGHLLASLNRYDQWHEENYGEAGPEGAPPAEYMRTRVWNPKTGTWSEDLAHAENLRAVGTSVDRAGNVMGFGFGALGTDRTFPGAKNVPIRWLVDGNAWAASISDPPSDPDLGTGFSTDMGAVITRHAFPFTDGLKAVTFGEGSRISWISQPGESPWALKRFIGESAEPLYEYHEEEGSFGFPSFAAAGDMYGWYEVSIRPPFGEEGDVEHKFAQVTGEDVSEVNPPPAGDNMVSNIAGIDPQLLAEGKTAVAWTGGGQCFIGIRNGTSGDLSWAIPRSIAGKISSRGEALRSVTEGEGEEAEEMSRLWRNGKWIELNKLVDPEKWVNLRGRGINHQGTIFALADKPDGNTKNVPILLMAIASDFLTRNPDTGDVSSMGGMLFESNPAPQVDLELTNAQIVGENLNVTVVCKYRDALSDLKGVSQVGQISFLHNGDVAATETNLSGAEQPAELWQERVAAATITQNLSVPLSAGIHTFTARTGLNGADNLSYDSVQVVVGKHATQQVTVGQEFHGSIAFGSALNPQAEDQITVTFPAQSPASLQENAPAALRFSGSASVNNATKPVSVRLKTPPTLDPAIVESFDAEILIGGSTPSYLKGRWRETGPNTKQFECLDLYPSGNSPASLFIEATGESDVAQWGDLSPFFARILVPTGAKEMFLPDGIFKVTLNDEEIQLVEHSGLIPQEDEAAGVTPLYVAEEELPRLFALLREEEGSSLTPEGAISEGRFQLKVNVRSTDQEILRIDPVVILTENSSEEMATLQAMQEGGGMQMMESESALNPQSFEEQMYIFYELLFQEYGQRLLQASRDANVSITFETIWGDFDNWDLEDYTDRARQEGKQPRLRLDKDDLKSPVRAANALFLALHELFHTFETAEAIRALNPPKTVPGGFTEDEAQAFYQLTQGRMVSMGKFLADAETAAEVGMSVWNEPLDLLLTISDSIDTWQSGRKKSAVVKAGLGLLPLTMIWAKKLDSSVLVRLTPNQALLSNEVLEVFEGAVEALNKSDRIGAMRLLRADLDAGNIAPEVIEGLWKMRFLMPPKKRTELLEAGIAARLGPKPPGTITHHDFPIQTGGSIEEIRNLQLEFFKRGIDPNDGAISGRFLPKDFHDNVIHWKGGGFGGRSAWNYQWEQFFAEAAQSQTHLNSADILAFLEELMARTSDVTKKAEEIEWIFTP